MNFTIVVMIDGLGLPAAADKTRIVPTKSKNKFCQDKFLFRLLYPHKKFQSRQILSGPDSVVFLFISLPKDSTFNFQDLSYVVLRL